MDKCLIVVYHLLLYCQYIIKTKQNSYNQCVSTSTRTHVILLIQIFFVSSELRFQNTPVNTVAKSHRLLAAADWTGFLLLSSPPLISCLHSSQSCQCSLFRFYAHQCSCIPPSQPTSEKIIGDRFAGRTFPQPRSKALSGKWLRLTECFTPNSSKENICVLLRVCKFTLFSFKCWSKRRSRSSKRWLLQRKSFFFLSLFPNSHGAVILLGTTGICFLALIDEKNWKAAEDVCHTCVWIAQNKDYKQGEKANLTLK